jgi:hypothetical protein
MAIIVATSDVSQSITDDLRQACGPDLGVRSRTSVALMSTDPPSFIKLVAESSEWSLALKLAASAFLAPFFAQLGKNAADNLWKNRAVIARALANASAAPIRMVITALRHAKSKARASTYIAIALPLPDEHCGTEMLVPTDSEEDAAVAVALFVEQLAPIEAAVRREIDAGRSFVGSVRVVPQKDGSVVLKWMDGKTNEPAELAVPRERGTA